MADRQMTAALDRGTDRPRGADGDACSWCLGHRPPDCYCQGVVDYPGLDGLNAYASRTHGRSLIALCSLAIDDPDADHSVAEAAFATRDRLAAKHGMPDPAWLAQERQWLRPRYDYAKRARAQFRHLDEAWGADPHRTDRTPPSYTAVVFAAMGRSMGLAIDMIYGTKPTERKESSDG